VLSGCGLKDNLTLPDEQTSETITAPMTSQDIMVEINKQKATE